ncbi:MAG: hypothetical protein U9P37_01710 [Pseudomonadota bacterium]|nr:hypothetical protein [Pseudomonadota bacterium]
MFSKEKKEYKRIRKTISEVNAKLTKLAKPERIREVGGEFGLVDKKGNLNLVKDGDTEAMMDLLIFHEKTEGKRLPELFLEKAGDDFLPILERQLMEDYLSRTFFSFYEVSDNKKRDFLTMSPLLDASEFELFDPVIGRVASEGWLFAGRFVPLQDYIIHTGVIYAFAQEAKEKIFDLLNEFDDVAGKKKIENPVDYPLYFYRWYKMFGTPMGQR